MSSLEYHRDYYHGHKDQMDQYSRSYYQSHKDEILARLKNNYERDRLAFFSMYGSVCACCGEAELDFLTIEHKQGLKGKRRPNSGMSYRDAIKSYRPDLYETLCMNCNHAKGRFGICPHQIKK